MPALTDAPWALPPCGTVERWCLDFVTTTELSAKLAPPALPDLAAEASWERDAPVRELRAPGRPRELRVAARSGSTPKPEALVQASARAKLVHTFVHHELQAAELFAWAVLRFPDSPREFRRGLLRLALEELGHLRSYAEHLERLGARVGDFSVRDWFWLRVGSCTTPLAFVSLQGLGLEGANLEHSARFAAQFRAAGDEVGARILEAVGEDEIAHVRFARRWFEFFAGAPLDYARWSAALPPPVTPSVLQGKPLNRWARERAGFDACFLDSLDAAPSTKFARPS